MIIFTFTNNPNLEHLLVVRRKDLCEEKYDSWVENFVSKFATVGFFMGDTVQYQLFYLKWKSAFCFPFTYLF